MSEYRGIPSSPTPVKEADCIRVGWTMATGCVLIALLVLFNRVPERVGMIISAGEPSSFAPLLGPESFRDILPRLNLWWGLTLALAVANLYIGRWTWGTRLADYALTFFGVFILARILVSPVFGLNPEWVQSGRPAVLIAYRLVPLLTYVVKGSLLAAIIGALVSLGAKLQAASRDVSLGTS